jgi:hypothetical protein
MDEDGFPGPAGRTPRSRENTQRRKYQEHMDLTLTIRYDGDDDAKAHISLQAYHHVMKLCGGRAENIAVNPTIKLT